MLLVQFAQDMISHGAMLSWTVEHFNLGQLGLGQLGLDQFGSWNLGWDLGSITTPIQGQLGQLQGQQFDTDVFRGARGIFNNFIRSGQLWAFLIGALIGYIFRAVTTYG